MRLLPLVERTIASIARTHAPSATNVSSSFSRANAFFLAYLPFLLRLLFFAR
jgi:hypothetical protein